MGRKSILKTSSKNCMKLRTIPTRQTKFKPCVSYELTKNKIFPAHQSILKTSKERINPSSGRSFIKSFNTEQACQSSVLCDTLEESKSLMSRHHFILKSKNTRSSPTSRQSVLKPVTANFKPCSKSIVKKEVVNHPSPDLVSDGHIKSSGQSVLKLSVHAQQSLLNSGKGIIFPQQSVLKLGSQSSVGLSGCHSVGKLNEGFKLQQSLLKPQVVTSELLTPNLALGTTQHCIQKADIKCSAQSPISSKILQQSVLKSETVSKYLQQQSVLKSDVKSSPPSQITYTCKNSQQSVLKSEMISKNLQQCIIKLGKTSFPAQHSVLKPEVLTSRKSLLKSVDHIQSLPTSTLIEFPKEYLAGTNVCSRSILKPNKSVPSSLSRIIQNSQTQQSLLKPINIKPKQEHSKPIILSPKANRLAVNRSILKRATPHILQSGSESKSTSQLLESPQRICSTSVEDHQLTEAKSNSPISIINVFSLADDQSSYIVEPVGLQNRSILNVPSDSSIGKEIPMPNEPGRLTELKPVKLIRLSHSNQEPYIRKKPQSDEMSFHENECSVQPIPVRQTELKPVKFIRLSHSKPNMESNDLFWLSHSNYTQSLSLSEPAHFPLYEQTSFPNEQRLRSLDELYQSSRPTGGWSVSFEGDQLVFTRADNGVPMITLRINCDFSVKLIVLKKDVTSFLSKSSRVLCNTFDMSRIFKELEEWVVCKGNYDGRMKEVVLARCRTSGVYVSETNAVHSIYCYLLVQRGTTERCKKCSVFRCYLRGVVGRKLSHYKANEDFKAYCSNLKAKKWSLLRKLPHWMKKNIQ